MRTSTALGSTLLTGALIAGMGIVPAAAASGPAGHRTCFFDAPGHIKLRVKLRLPLRTKHGNDLRGVRVRATDEDGRHKFRDRRVRVGEVTIKVEHVREKVGGASISSAQAVRRHGSPAKLRLNPRTSGSNVDRVIAEVAFRLDGGRWVLATCSAKLR